MLIVKLWKPIEGITGIQQHGDFAAVESEEALSEIHKHYGGRDYSPVEDVIEWDWVGTFEDFLKVRNGLEKRQQSWYQERLS